MYQVLYRKYRPKVFSDVYGQDHVTSTLKNEIKEGRISHAYLFTGSRGTGKTTCAKILARAVNCENSNDGEPCNECEVCKGLDSGSIYDVVEIDAASNNGVDNIRDIREEVNYTPSRGKYRVYIIDEVHMLSTGAFNALLKTLEEPPEHVIFILATTEVHKLPATILSRCQRFDFKRIQPETMAKRLNQVAKLENLTLDDDAAILIARIADGALRDGLSILDQCAGRNDKITSSLVSEVAGIAGREALYQLSDAIYNKNTSSAITIISELYNNSYDMERLCVEMISHFRNFLIVKSVKKNRQLIISTDDEYNQIAQKTNEFSIENIIYSLDLFEQKLTRIKSGANARVEMELAFVTLCEPKLDESNEAILDRLATLERTVKNGITVKQSSFTQSENNPQEAVATEDKPPVQAKVQEKQEIPQIKEDKEECKENNFTDNMKEETEIPPLEENLPPQQESILPPLPPQQEQGVENKTSNSTQQLFTQWADFMDIIHRSDIAIFGLLSGAKGYVRDNFFLIDSPNPTIKEFISISTHSKAIKQALFELTGVQYKLGLFKKNNQTAKVTKDPLDDLINKAKENNISVTEK